MGKKLAKLGLTLLFALTTPAAVSNAVSIDGAILEAQYRHRTRISDPDFEYVVGPTQFTVGPGVELSGYGAYDSFDPVIPDLPALMDIDVSDGNVTFTLIINQPPNFTESITIAELGSAVGPGYRAMVNLAETNWAGFLPSSFDGGGGGIFLNLAGLRGLAGQKISIDFVPEPATCTLAAMCGAALLGAGRCWRRGG